MSCIQAGNVEDSGVLAQLMAIDAKSSSWRTYGATQQSTQC